MVSLRLTWLTSFGSRVTWQGDGEEHKTSGRRDGGGHVIFYELARSNFLAIRDKPWWRGAGRLTAQDAVLRTGVTVGLTGEPGKRLGALRAFAGWRDRLRCGQALCSGLRWP